MSNDAIVLGAESLEGRSFGADSALYTQTVVPADYKASKAEAMRMASGMSSCGLTCEEVLRVAEVDGRIGWNGRAPEDVLRVPYATRLRRGQVAVAVQWELARQRGLRVETARYDGQARPTVADQPLIGKMPPVASRTANPALWDEWSIEWGGVEHVLTVVDVTGDIVTSIDGGQTDARNGGKPTAIKRVQRRLWVCSGELWLASLEAKARDRGRPTVGRRVQGWGRAGELPCVPPGAT